uniref:AN1-type domain-containing protein n=1 Tax=Heligmosomoides polygyrus TaxID=6339 RepID=A0A183FHV1_HELPZ
LGTREKSQKSKLRVCRKFNFCRQKLSLSDQEIRCYCNNVFCKRHRDPSKHCCPIDYRITGRNQLMKVSSLWTKFCFASVVAQNALFRITPRWSRNRDAPTKLTL